MAVEMGNSVKIDQLAGTRVLISDGSFESLTAWELRAVGPSAETAGPAGHHGWTL